MTAGDCEAGRADNQIRGIVAAAVMVMVRLSALSVALLLPVSALARPPDCWAKCASDQKDCEIQCSRKAGKHAATCKGACTELTEPCRDNCKKKEERRK